ncbi:hypothetical protein MUP01_01135 [Candidatus Bathyarchaeota archaeon]|nr:hypothetical protein [Candidatus Bathyarchaeota archaeon]
MLAWPLLGESRGSGGKRLFPFLLFRFPLSSPFSPSPYKNLLDSRVYILFVEESSRRIFYQHSCKKHAGVVELFARNNSRQTTLQVRRDYSGDDVVLREIACWLYLLHFGHELDLYKS